MIQKLQNKIIDNAINNVQNCVKSIKKVQKWWIFATFLFGFITRAGDGFRSTLCVCVQICSYSNFADACSHIQILNQGNKSCRGHKPLTTKNFNNKNTPDGAFLLLNWLRGMDLNHRPSGYEPDELPDCSTPRWCSAFYHIFYGCQIFLPLDNSPDVGLKYIFFVARIKNRCFRV